jgi:ribosomal protein S18 acetylase RimI-like enzyme
VDDADVAVPLIYETSRGMYDRWAGNRERAFRILGRAFRGTGADASHEVCWVAELDGRVAGVMAAFPAREQESRGRNIILRMLRGTPPWLWARTLRLYRRGRALPDPPDHDSSFYIDALAADSAHRRRGVARALLTTAEAEARRLGLRAVHLDTTIDTAGARATYEATGFEVTQELPAAHGIPGQVSYARPVSA